MHVYSTCYALTYDPAWLSCEYAGSDVCSSLVILIVAAELGVVMVSINSAGAEAELSESIKKVIINHLQNFTAEKKN